MFIKSPLKCIIHASYRKTDSAENWKWNDIKRQATSAQCGILFYKTNRLKETASCLTER